MNNVDTDLEKVLKCTQVGNSEFYNVLNIDYVTTKDHQKYFYHMSGLPVEILAWGGDTSPPIGGGHMGGGQGSDGGGLARKSRQNLEGSQISEECK